MRNLQLLFIVLVVSSCIDPYNVEVPEGERMLSVEGHITNGPGPHTVKLTRTATYGSIFVDFNRPVTHASVGIRENETGIVNLLTETEQGIYHTSTDFIPIAGNSYSLLITTSEGSEYISFPSKLIEAPKLDSLSFTTISFPTNNRLVSRSGLQLTAFFKDPSDQQNFYFWNMKNPISTVKTYPEFYKPPFSLPTDPFQPKDCCKYCDIPGFPVSRGLYLTDDSNFNGLATNQIAGYIEDDGLRLSFEYRFEFEQMAISEETFRFLTLVNQQMTLTGSVFDPPPANIRGNLVSLSDPEETVLGHFFAAGVSSRKVTLLGSELELLQFQQPINDDCRLIRNSVVSAYWVND